MTDLEQIKDEKIVLQDGFVEDVRSIIMSSRDIAIRSVDSERVRMYWRLGERIVVEEQNGATRAEYGKGLLSALAKKIEPEFGSGFSYRQLAFCRQFYQAYPIVNELRSQFNWTQYRKLIQTVISNDST